MQDPIRQPAGWNHHHWLSPILFRCIYLFPFTSCFWILRIDFYMYRDGFESEEEEGAGGILHWWVNGGPGNDEQADWMLVHHSPFSWLQVVSHFLDQRISSCLYMTAWARQFACSTDNKRACACQNRWRCVTVSTQCCLLLAWPSTSRHVSFHNQGKGKTGQRNHPGFLPSSFCCRFFRINLIPMPLAMLFLSRFLRFSVCLSFLPSACLSATLCLWSLFVFWHKSTHI